MGKKSQPHIKPVHIKPVHIKPVHIKPIHIKPAHHKPEHHKPAHHSPAHEHHAANVHTGTYSSGAGISYPYSKYIKSPTDLGVSGNGDLKTLGNDITALVAYAEVLTTGASKASATNEPLGNKFFLPTHSKCTDVDTNNSVDRYIYFSNVPAGNIPFLTPEGTDVQNLRGLVPGILSNAANLQIPNPADIFQSFSSNGTGNKCKNITLEVIDINNNKATESQYVALSDISQMDPCLFPNKTNPANGNKCFEMFDNLHPHKKTLYNSNNNHNNYNEMLVYKIPDDMAIQLYFVCFSILIIYLMMKILFSKQKTLL